MSIVFISHKLDEVLEIADRITVLRRGKKIDTVPTEGATEQSLAEPDGRPRRAAARREARRQARRAGARGRGPARARRPRARGGARASRSRCAAGEIVGDRRRRRQRPARAGRGDRRVCASAESGRDRASTGEDVTGRRRRAARSTPASAHIPEDRHRRGLVLDFTLAENLALREYRHAADLALGLARRPRSMNERAPRAAQGVRRARRRAGDARGLAVGRQPAEGRARARDRRATRSVLIAAPAHARARRRRDRVRPPAAASRSATRAAAILLVSLELEEVRSLADRILVIYEGEIVGEFPPDASEEELGVAMTGGGAARRRGVDASRLPSRAGRPDDRRRRRPAHVAAAPPTCAAAGVIVPLLTVLLAFLVGGLVVLVHRQQPDRDLRGDLRGHRASTGSSRGSTGEDRTVAALNLQQTLIITTPLILTGLAVAFAFRCRPVQHRRPGPVHRRRDRRRLGRLLVRRACRRCLHILLAIIAACAGGRRLGGHRGLPEGDRRAPTR